ncbi:recQ-mediated genome instability protein 1 [Apis mellifera]|uniref:RecQ-mediated genome instability protein 1 n=1 Tax=Apis mellifera TaxID=7460 RepID=A0A7M7MNP0_APIME|nr:recQ-mediated genome instability protein 1 [Apis mellifera]|eukprot:XP_026298720.1 recQ-mediated genome instability protein 1 [Apis mellifera]
MNENIFRQIKNRLKLECYLMNNEWLRDCIEFYMNQHKNSTMEEILQFVRGQWQLSDLREINNDNGSLPPKLSEKKFIILSGNYILQVEQMYNITKAKYKQLKEIRNVNFSEVDPAEEEMMKKMTKTQKKRMMQLKLTDGLQNIIGIEYNPIPQLNDMLLPGYKVMIIGPIICRRGVLLLEEGKLKGIGGEVDNLLIPNALENILARALNLPENPDPYNDNEIKSNNIQKEEPEIDDNFFEEDFEINFTNVSKNTNSHNKNEEIIIESHNKNESPIKTKIENINTEIKNVQNYEDEKIIDDDDCFLEMIDEKQFIETQIEQNVITPFKALPNEEDDDLIIINEEEENNDVKHDIFRNTIKNDSSHLYPTSLVKKNVSHSKVQEKQQCLLINKEISTSTDSSSSETLKKNKTDRHITEFIKVVTVPKEEKICEFIHDINNEIITNNIFKIIRGHVEVLGKLSKKDSLWILEAIIADGTGTIEVSFSNKLLENLLGFSVKEFSLKKKLKKNPEIEHELRMSFRNAEQKIKTLDALLKLELNINKKPIVIEIMDLTQEQKKIIDKRLSNFLLKNCK